MKTLYDCGKVFLGLSIIFGASRMAEASPPPAGTIKLIKGDVQIVDVNAKVIGDTTGKRPRNLVIGAPFYVGETIVTRNDGRVKLEFVEGKNEVVLGTNTSLLIERASTDPLKGSGTTLGLARGEVRSTVNQKYSGQGTDTYEVKTPNAVAGVRGTIFVATFNPTTFQSQVATERGLVSVKNAAGGAPVLVKPGMFTSTAGNTAAAQPAPLSANKDLQHSISNLSGSGSNSSDSSGSKGDSSSGASAGNGNASNSAPASGSSASSGGSSSNAASNGNSSSGSSSANSNSSASSSSGASGSSSGSASSGSPSSSTATASNAGPTSAPLGQETVVTTTDSSGRSPASIGSVGGTSGSNAFVPVQAVAPASPAPMSSLVSQTLSQSISTLSTVTQTVNQTVQQAKASTGTINFTVH